MNDWAELERILGIIAASGRAKVREDGEWLADFNPLHFEICHQGKNALVHLWSAEQNLTRRVLSVKERAEERILLEVQRFGRAKPGRLEFLCTSAPPPAIRISREQFRARIRRVLSESFPDAAIESLTVNPDLKHSFSRLYVRGQMHEGSSTWAVLAVPPAEETPSAEASLAFGILWLDWLRSRADRRVVEGLRLFVPENSSPCLRERLLALSSSARAEVFEFSLRNGQCAKLTLRMWAIFKAGLCPARKWNPLSNRRATPRPEFPLWLQRSSKKTLPSRNGSSPGLAKHPSHSAVSISLAGPWKAFVLGWTILVCLLPKPPNQSWHDCSTSSTCIATPWRKR